MTTDRISTTRNPKKFSNVYVIIFHRKLPRKFFRNNFDENPILRVPVIISGPKQSKRRRGRARKNTARKIDTLYLELCDIWFVNGSVYVRRRLVDDFDNLLGNDLIYTFQKILSEF
ncbi:hypothetical protein GWI33_013512 [Rhynchophorus ferrugineus]|uniref:Uncharacterized protein n=1 Tax=Rhynchophorus ferrugineus TaxID=354439 RepID=A0A834MD65_RHYFE|nr:hypothetical protein GWI33_013512 [Rhynchophorus ferrugineus]